MNKVNKRGKCFIDVLLFLESEEPPFKIREPIFKQVELTTSKHANKKSVVVLLLGLQNSEKIYNCDYFD